MRVAYSNSPVVIKIYGKLASWDQLLFSSLLWIYESIACIFIWKFSFSSQMLIRKIQNDNNIWKVLVVIFSKTFLHLLHLWEEENASTHCFKTLNKFKIAVSYKE